MHGNLRKIDHIRRLARAYFTEVSARNAMLEPLCGRSCGKHPVNHAAAESANDVSYGTLREPCQQKTFLRSVSRKLPKTMPQRSAIAAHLTEASEKHGRKRVPLRHISRKTPHNEPRREQSADQFAEDSEKQTVLRPPRGRSCGRFRVMGRHSGNLWHVVRKVPRNTPRRNPEMAYLTEASEKQATNKAQNSTSKRP